MYKIKVVCRGLIIDSQDNILVVKKTGSDFFSLPGGKLENSDLNLEVCLTRELEEELRIKCKIDKIEYVKELHKNNVRYIELIWSTKIVSGILPDKDHIFLISNGELDAIQWVSKENLSDFNIRPDFIKNHWKKVYID